MFKVFSKIEFNHYKMREILAQTCLNPCIYWQISLKISSKQAL